MTADHGQNAPLRHGDAEPLRVHLRQTAHVVPGQNREPIGNALLLVQANAPDLTGFHSRTLYRHVDSLEGLRVTGGNTPMYRYCNQSSLMLRRRTISVQ